MQSALKMFLFAGVFSEATTQRHYENQLYLIVWKFSWIYIARFFQNKTVLSSVYSKNLKLYKSRLQQRSQSTSQVHKNISIYYYHYFFFGFVFIYQGFLSQTLTIRRTAGEGRGPSFIPLYDFHPLANIQTFICNFACEMTITYITYF